MSCISTTCQQSLTLDPYKRVCYSQGLVLGVDEFVQEELYFLEQHRRHQRGLHGYGTICGLEVRVRDASPAEGPEIVVAPGLAVDPVGRTVRVPEAQCALINDWLARHGDALGSPPPGSGSPADPVTLYLRLCYRECKTDHVPIPSGPCRSADETSTPSRVSEDFCLELDTVAPDQGEVDAVRAFGALLRSLEVDDVFAPTITLEELEDLVRALSPLASPPLAAASPGSPGDALRVAPEDVAAYLDAAFRVWVTQVRPSLLPDGGNCAAGPPQEGCVLLARLDLPVATGATGLRVDGDAAAVLLDETERPYLLHTQLLQELLLAGAPAGNRFSGGEDHGALEGLLDDDHPRYLLVEERGAGSPTADADTLLRDLSGDGSHRLVELPPATASGEAMPWGQQASGDLRDSYPAPSVVGLHGRAVPEPQSADDGRFLQVTGGGASLAWADPPAGPGPGPSGNFEQDLTRVWAASWVHNQPHDFSFILDGERVRGLAIAFGVREAGDIGVLIGRDRDANGNPVLDLGSLDECSFQVYVEGPVQAGLRERRRVAPVDIVAIRPVVTAGSTLFVEGTRIQERIAPAALLLVPPEVTDVSADTKFFIVLHGDHVLDERERAVDAELLRSRLPTGDRPAGSDRGLQGGTLHSWFRTGNRARGGPLDANAATVDELVRTADLREDLALELVRERARRPDGFTDLRELEAVNGIGPRTVDRLRTGDVLVVRPRR